MTCQYILQTADVLIPNDYGVLAVSDILKNWEEVNKISVKKINFSELLYYLATLFHHHAPFVPPLYLIEAKLLINCTKISVSLTMTAVGFDTN